jgi:hypothetical protein
MKYMLLVCADPSIEWTPADQAYADTSMVTWLAARGLKEIMSP